MAVPSERSCPVTDNDSEPGLPYLAYKHIEQGKRTLGHGAKRSDEGGDCLCMKLYVRHEKMKEKGA